MQKKIWINLSLGVLVLALAFALYFRVGQPAVHPSQALLAIPPHSVHRLAFAFANHPQVVFRKIGRQWWLVEPFRARAENLNLESLIDDLDEPVHAAYPTSRFKLGTIGLDPARMRLWVNGQELDYGANDPVGHFRFIRMGARILLVKDVLYYRLSGSFYPLLSPRLLPPGSHLTALRIPGLTLTRTAKGAWRLTPREKEVSSGMIARLIRRWTYASALSVGPPDDARPFGTIAIRLFGRKRPRVFHLVHDSFGFALISLTRPLRFVFPKPVESKMLSLAANRRKPHARATRG
ncbi:MAG: hypothetical protein ACYCS1_10925 [Gammaproteobacteria bacterium]